MPRQKTNFKICQSLCASCSDRNIPQQRSWPGEEIWLVSTQQIPCCEGFKHLVVLIKGYMICKSDTPKP